MDMPRLTGWVALFGLVALLGPLALELAGVVPASFEVTGGRIVLHPRLVEFKEPLTSVLTLFALNASALAAPFLLARMRDNEDRLRRREAQRNWRLEQLLPGGDREARSSAVPKSP